MLHKSSKILQNYNGSFQKVDILGIYVVRTLQYVALLSLLICVLQPLAE